MGKKEKQTEMRRAASLARAALRISGVHTSGSELEDFTRLR
jgi:hypothetical protein